jgi:hypothetical protein
VLCLSFLKWQRGRARRPQACLARWQGTGRNDCPLCRADIVLGAGAPSHPRIQGILPFRRPYYPLKYFICVYPYKLYLSEECLTL